MSKIKDLRLKAGKSRAILAEERGVSYNAIKNWEEDITPLNKMRAEHMYKMCESLGISIKDFMALFPKKNV